MDQNLSLISGEGEGEGGRREGGRRGEESHEAELDGGWTVHGQHVKLNFGTTTCVPPMVGQTYEIK